MGEQSHILLLLVLGWALQRRDCPGPVLQLCGSAPWPQTVSAEPAGICSDVQSWHQLQKHRAVDTFETLEGIQDFFLELFHGTL